MRTSDGRMSLKSTSSAVSRDRISWTTAMVRTRRSASSRAWRAWPGGMPAGLQAQQRRDGLQVVLDPVVDLADGGILGQQEAVPPAQVADVAHEDQRAGHRAVVEQRDAAQHDRGVAPSLDLLGRRQPGLVGQRHGRLVEAGLVEAHAFEPGVHAHAVQGVDGVRRGVVDPGAGVEHQHPVADPRRLAGDHLVDREGELALATIMRAKPVEDLDVDPLQLARAGGPTDSADSRVISATNSALPPHRDAHQAGPLAAAAGWPTSPSTTLPRLPGPGQERAVLGPIDHVPTRSSRCRVWLVVGRTWPEHDELRRRRSRRPARTAAGRRSTGPRAPPSRRPAAAGGRRPARPGRCAPGPVRPASPWRIDPAGS